MSHRLILPSGYVYPGVNSSGLDPEPGNWFEGFYWPRAFLWNKSNKGLNFFIDKVFDVRFVVNGEKVNGIILKNIMGNNPCSARFSFALTGNGKTYLIAVMADGSAFVGFLL